jgi:hypothetical protein
MWYNPGEIAENFDLLRIEGKKNSQRNEIHRNRHEFKKLTARRNKNKAARKSRQRNRRRG